MKKQFSLIVCVVLFWCMSAFAVSRGGVVVFQSTRDGNSEIYSINGDGTDVKRLTNDPASDINPRLSRDGRQIAFASDRSGHYEIWTTTVNGTNLHQVTEGSTAEHQSSEAAWSPDNTALV